MAIKQLSIFVENKAGKIVEVTELLAKNNIDLRALSIADTQDYGILRTIVDDTEKAKSVLEENGSVYKVTEVIGVEIPDVPGGMSKVMRILSDNGVNIEYVYAFISRSKEFAYVVMRVRDNEKAEKILTDNGINLVDENEISDI
ncbi:MAG: ACT domain-containing protein [Clostridia bacterium]|nr:ACT domain-containing protein [Clostridia bacterium]